MRAIDLIIDNDYILPLDGYDVIGRFIGSFRNHELAHCFLIVESEVGTQWNTGSQERTNCIVKYYSNKHKTIPDLAKFLSVADSVFINIKSIPINTLQQLSIILEKEINGTI